MTKTQAIAKFAAAYRAHVAPKCAVLSMDVATAYAVQDLMNLIKNQEQYAVELIMEEIAYIERAA
jgi:hypothetical protein